VATRERSAATDIIPPHVSSLHLTGWRQQSQKRQEPPLPQQSRAAQRLTATPSVRSPVYPLQTTKPEFVELKPAHDRSGGRGTGAERSRARCSLWNSGTKRPKREEPGEARRARRNERTYRRPRRCPRPRASAPPMRTAGGGGPRRAPELAASLRSRRHSTRRGLGHEH
jgi:hypothetical protein